MTLRFTVISKHPPGGRCTLYAGYAGVLARHLGAEVAVTYTDLADAHAGGYPSLLLNGQVLRPADGVILMPADLCAAIESHGVPAEAVLALAQALEVPLERMMDEAG
jgi:cystathionine gamma-synthase